MLFHDGKMDRVAGRQAPILQNNLLGAFDRRAIDRQDLIDHGQQRIESWLDCVPAINRHVAVQYLLQHLGVGHQTLTFPYQFLQPSLRLCFERMWSTNKIHRDIRINQNHGRTPAP